MAEDLDGFDFLRFTGSISTLETDWVPGLNRVPFGFGLPHRRNPPCEGAGDDEHTFGSPSASCFPTRPYSVSYEVGSL